MNKKITLLAATVTALAVAAPAQATWWKHVHYCSCGHSQGGKLCGSTSSGGTTTTSGGTTTTTSGGSTTSGGTTTSSGGTTTSGGSSSTSGGTAVPEPGVLGLFGIGLLGLGLTRRRQKR